MADFASQPLSHWEVVCDRYTSQKLWNHRETAVTFPDRWSGQHSQPHEPLCPPQLAPFSNNEWAVRYPAAYTTWSSPSLDTFSLLELHFKVAVSNRQITFQLSSPCTGDYSSLGKERIFSKLACDLFFFLVFKKTVWNVSPSWYFDQSEPQGLSIVVARPWLSGWEGSPLTPDYLIHTANAFCHVRDVLTTPQRFFFFPPVFKYMGIVSQAATGPAWATAGS